jgi:hypothetical protein
MAKNSFTLISQRFQYGTSATLTFKVSFPTAQTGGYNYTYGTKTSLPTAGNITLAAATIALTTADIKSPETVCAKIKSNGVAGYVVVIKNNEVTLINSTVGVTAEPVHPALDTATNILFSDFAFVAGKAISIGAQEDIDLRGRLPINFTASFSGGAVGDIQISNGSEADQIAGSLVYGTALVLSSINGLANSATVTTPARWARLTTKAGNTTAALAITSSIA